MVLFGEQARSSPGKTGQKEGTGSILELCSKNVAFRIIYSQLYSPFTPTLQQKYGPQAYCLIHLTLPMEHVRAVLFPPQIFALVMEPLSEAIRVHSLISGLQIGAVTHKIGLYVDDMIVAMTNPTQSLFNSCSFLVKSSYTKLIVPSTACLEYA